MALFTLTDIKFNKGTKERTGRASSQLVGGNYEMNLMRYPEDIGNYDRGHYMVIHINTQLNSQFTSTAAGDDPTIIANRKQYGYDNPFTNLKSLGQSNMLSGAVNTATDFGGTLKNLISSTSVGSSVSGAVEGLVETTKEVFKSASSVSGARTIKRTTDTIALYMPDTMNFVHQQQYSEASLTGLPSAVLAGGASAADALKNNSGGDVMKTLTKNLSPYLANYAFNKFGDLGKFAFAAGFGLVQNPQLELLYTSPAFRSFRFDFMFYPRSESEAKEVQNILNRLKFHQAPEIRKESKGFFLVPPSEFDIKFYYNGAENPNIPQISTCVLESIDVDYAPNGFATYEVPGQLQASKGETGMPVAIRLSLQFKETEILTKDHFDNLKKINSELNKVGASYEDWMTGNNGMGNYGE